MTLYVKISVAASWVHVLFRHCQKSAAYLDVYLKFTGIKKKGPTSLQSSKITQDLLTSTPCEEMNLDSLLSNYQVAYDTPI